MIFEPPGYTFLRLIGNEARMGDFCGSYVISKGFEEALFGFWI